MAGAPSLLSAVIGGILAVIIVAAAAAESITQGSVDPALLVMATAVVATFFTGQAVRQVNGTQVASLTSAVMGLHSRLDTAGLAPARDGTPPPAP